MNSFKTPEISDKIWVDEILKSFYAPSLEYSFSTLFLWADIIGSKIAKHKSCFLACYGKNLYLFPTGNNDDDKISAINHLLKIICRTVFRYLYYITNCINFQELLLKNYQTKKNEKSPFSLCNRLKGDSVLWLLSGFCFLGFFAFVPPPLRKHSVSCDG